MSLAVVFAAGAVSGSVATHYVIKRSMENSLKFQHWSSDTMRLLKTKLNLTAEQCPKIQAIIDQTSGEFRTVFGRTMDESGQIILRTQRLIDQQLTPEQRALHDEMKRKLRADLKKHNINLPED